MKALEFPFRIEGGTIATTTDYRKIVRDQLVDTITTNRYERVMRPDYGANVNVLLFDPSDYLVRQDAAGYLKLQLSTQCPRAYITDVLVSVEETSPNIVRVEVIYTVRFVAESLVVKVETGDASNG